MISSIGFVAAASDNANNHSIDVNDSSSSNLLELNDEIHYCPLGDNHYEIPEVSADYIHYLNNHVLKNKKTDNNHLSNNKKADTHLLKNKKTDNNLLLKNKKVSSKQYLKN